MYCEVNYTSKNGKDHIVQHAKICIDLKISIELNE